MPKKKKGRRGIAFEWNGTKIFLPQVVIQSNLRKAADDVLTGGNEVPEETNWNPTWSEDSDSGSDELFRVVKIGSKSKKFKNKKESSDDGGLELKSKKNGSPVQEEEIVQKTEYEGTRFGHQEKKPTKDIPQSSSVSRRKLFSREELFKNWGGQQSQESEEQHEISIGNSKQSSSTEKNELSNVSNELTCMDCGKTFAKKIHLNLHQKIHNRMDNLNGSRKGQDIYTCNTCQRQFNSKENLADHIQTIHNLVTSSSAVKSKELDSEFNCEKCNRRFERSNQLKLHSKLCKSKQTVENNTGSTLQKQVHIKEKLINHAEFVCGKCDRRFERSNQLKLHSRLCRWTSNLSPDSSTLKHICKKCNRTFDRSNQLKFHQTLCKSSSSTSIQNNVVPESNKEEDLPHPVGPTKFTCADCGREFKFRHYLNFHMKVHMKTCKGCNITFHQNEYAGHSQICLNINTSEKSLTKEIPETCSTCGNCFSDQSSLNRHELLHQYSIEAFEETNTDCWNLIMPFSCNQVGCTSRFSHEMDLDLHVEKCHDSRPTSAPTFYYIQDKQLPPLNPYVLLPEITVKQPAEAARQQRSPEKVKNLENGQPQHKYFCQKCKREFQNESMFKTHMNIHVTNPSFRSVVNARFRHDIPRQSVYTCQTCNRKFTKRNLYISHIGAHKREEKFTCHTCERKFQSLSAFQEHMNRHAADPTYKYSPRLPFGHDIPMQDVYTCETCGDKFDKRDNFLVHLREEKFKCKLCGRMFQSEALLATHVERHSDPSYIPGVRGRGHVRLDVPFQDEYTCETCGEKFDKRNLFLLHLREEKFKCKICNRGFQSEGQLTAHIERHSDPSYVPGIRGYVRSDIPFQDEYTCETCGEKFDKRNLFLLHLREEKYKCKICNKGFQSDALLEGHMKRHTDPSYVPGSRGYVRSDVPFQDEYTCETCGKKFDKRNLFLLHLREEKFKCKICNKGFQSDALLTGHMKRHDDPCYVPGSRGHIRSDVPFQDEYTCETCGEKFDKRNLFLLHLREEKFKCKICNRGFLSEGQLTAHIERHSDPSYVPGKRGRFRNDIPIQSVYTCQTCQKSFTERHYYLIHISQHKRESKYQCIQCQRKFLTSGLFEIHMKKHADPSFRPRRPRSNIPIQDIYECEKCDKVFTTRNRYICHLNYHRYLQSHTRSKGPGVLEIPYQDVYFCAKCNNRAFSRREDYIQHLYYHKNSATQNVFGRGRPKRSDIPIQEVYNCEVCQKSFVDRLKYIIHLRNHTEKRHKCEGCLKMFKTVQSRDVHQQRFCKRIPCKFKCDRCNDRFHNKITLARHFHRFHSKVLETTTAEIEYPCNLCSQTFNTTFGLTRHRQVYHPDSNASVEQSNVNVDISHDENNTSPHSWDAYSDDENPMLAANLCETELSENPASRKSSDSEIKALKRMGVLCSCGTSQKYKTQKLCGNLRCTCVKAGNRCNKACNCADSCVNNAQLELEQQQKFKEGKESMIQADAEVGDQGMEDSVPIVIGYSDDTILEPQPSTSSLEYSIPTSEFIDVDDEQDEAMHQLSFEGYVEGTDDVDPLADPFESVAEGGGGGPPQEVGGGSDSTPANNPLHSVNNRVEDSSLCNNTNAVPTLCSVTASVSLDSFSQTANLRCQFCKKNFKTIPTYISHFLIHEKVNAVLTCPICLKDFQNQLTSYAQHLEAHNKGIELQCTKCSSKFKTYKDMEKHLHVHHFRPMECGVCNVKFQNSQLMMSHWSKEHPTCQCGLCNVKFFSYDDLTFHMKALHAPFDCLRCNQRFNKLEHLLDHFSQKHSTETSSGQPKTLYNGFKCTYCSDTFSSGEDLNDHLSNHLSSHNSTYLMAVPEQSPKDRYDCNHCKATFTSTEDLHDHLAHHILSTVSFSSNNTRQTFTTAENNKIGELVNDGAQAVEVFACPKCGKTLHSRNGWRTHLTLVHNNISLCSACDSFFDTREGLMSHLQGNSSCEVYFCEICNKNFQSKRLLSQHRKCVHEKERGADKATIGTTSENPGMLSRSSQMFVGTSSDVQIVMENQSFPVIIASTSLAHTQFARATNLQNNTLQSQQVQEIEEIVLD